LGHWHNQKGLDTTRGFGTEAEKSHRFIIGVVAFVSKANPTVMKHGAIIYNQKINQDLFIIL
jgi:hypothetical protein